MSLKSHWLISLPPFSKTKSRKLEILSVPLVLKTRFTVQTDPPKITVFGQVSEDAVGKILKHHQQNPAC